MSDNGYINGFQNKYTVSLKTRTIKRLIPHLILAAQNNSTTNGPLWIDLSMHEFQALLIFFGQQRGRENIRPFNAQPDISPQYTTLVNRGVVFSGLVEKI